jgi:hypothetical protein
MQVGQFGIGKKPATRKGYAIYCNAIKPGLDIIRNTKDKSPNAMS